MGDLAAGRKLWGLECQSLTSLANRKIYPTKLKAHQVVQKVEMDNFNWSTILERDDTSQTNSATLSTENNGLFDREHQFLSSTSTRVNSRQDVDDGRQGENGNFEDQIVIRIP